MAEPTQETPPVIAQPAPSSTRPTLDSITQEDLSREINGGDTPPPEKANFKEEGGEFRVGGDRGVAEKELDFGAKAREMMAKKIAEQNKPKEEPVVETPPPKKEAISADDAPPPKPAAQTDEVPEDERRVLPHDKPATAKRINYFLKELDKTRKELEEARKTATAAPTATNVEEFNKLKEEHTKTSDELLRYRRRYEVENDKEFTSKYDEPVAHAETAIESTLKKYNLGDATLKAIKDEGGFAAFSRSSRTFQINEDDGEGGSKMVTRTAAELSRNWLNALAVADAEFIKQAVGKQQMLGEEKKHAIGKAVEESKQFFEARTAEQRKAQEAAQKDNEAKTAEFVNMVKTSTEKTDWLKDKPVPQNATPEQAKEVEEYNKFQAQLRAKLVAHPKTAAEYHQIMLDAAHADYLRRDGGTKDAKIKALETELARIKGAQRTTPKGGSLLSDAGKPSKKDDGIAPDDFKSGLRKSFARVSGEADE